MDGTFSTFKKNATLVEALTRRKHHRFIAIMRLQILFMQLIQSHAQKFGNRGQCIRHKPAGLTAAQGLTLFAFTTLTFRWVIFGHP